LFPSLGITCFFPLAWLFSRHDPHFFSPRASIVCFLRHHLFLSLGMKLFLSNGTTCFSSWSSFVSPL
jgi:hypothetical protein